MMNRRHVLAVLAAAPYAASCAPSADPAIGWREPGAGQADPRRFALAHAVLAPNPHNTQPWQVTLDGERGMTLYCDLDRRLPFTDPYDRQITIGCGAFLELYRIAAASQGHFAQVTYFPDGEPSPRLDDKPLARVEFLPTANAAADPLFEYITQRRTNRNVYDAERVPDEALLLRATSSIAGFMGAAQWTTQPERVTALRDLVWRAFDRELRTRKAQEETYRWLRFGEGEIARHRDGLGVQGPLAGVLRWMGFLDEENMLNPDGFANQSTLKDWREKAMSSPAFMWLATADDRPATRLAAGAAYARLNLTATALGLAIHPWSQALEEYPDMAELYAEAKHALGADDQTVQMLVRVGYADPVPPSPRRDPAALIRA